MRYNDTGTIIKDLQGYFKMDQLYRMEEAAVRFRDKVLIRLLTRSGRRVTEIIGRKGYVYNYPPRKMTKFYPSVPGITPSDLDEEECMIRYRILKKRLIWNPHKRVMEHPSVMKTIDKDTMDMLLQYIEQANIKPQERIFPINRHRVYQIIRECADRAGIPLVGSKTAHPHHFRHSFAVHIIKNATNPSALRLLQRELEHSNINVTAGYLQFDQKEIKTLREKTFSKKVRH